MMTELEATTGWQLRRAFSFAPPGLALRILCDPRLAPWAAFYRRFAAPSCLVPDKHDIAAIEKAWQ
jgi:hypothetical protein